LKLVYAFEQSEHFPCVPQGFYLQDSPYEKEWSR
jgi:hypothetical protein